MTGAAGQQDNTLLAAGHGTARPGEAGRGWARQGMGSMRSVNVPNATCSARHDCTCALCIDRREERAQRQLRWTDPLMALYALQASGLTFDDALDVVRSKS